MHVLIVGGGVSGLMLGLLLEHFSPQNNITYQILERQSEADYNLRGSLQLSPASLAMMDQLGILTEYYKIARPNTYVSMYKCNLKYVGQVDNTHIEQAFGYPVTYVSRLDFCRFLISKLPKERIEWKRHVKEIVHGDLGVIVTVQTVEQRSVDAGEEDYSEGGGGGRREGVVVGEEEEEDQGVLYSERSSLPLSLSNASPSTVPPFTLTPSQGWQYGGLREDEEWERWRQFEEQQQQHHSPQHTSAPFMSRSGNGSGGRYRKSSAFNNYRSPKKEQRYEGDILIGADGTYSAVRQSMYAKIIATQRRLDLERLQFRAAEKTAMQQTCTCGSNCFQGGEGGGGSAGVMHGGTCAARTYKDSWNGQGWFKEIPLGFTHPVMVPKRPAGSKSDPITLPVLDMGSGSSPCAATAGGSSCSLGSLGAGASSSGGTKSRVHPECSCSRGHLHQQHSAQHHHHKNHHQHDKQKPRQMDSHGSFEKDILGMGLRMEDILHLGHGHGHPSSSKKGHRRDDSNVDPHLAGKQGVDLGLVFGGHGGHSPNAPASPTRPKGVHLSKTDKLPLKVQEIAVHGITEPLDPELFPDACNPHSEAKTISDKTSNYSILITCLRGNRVCWNVIGPVLLSGHELDGNFKASEWGQEMAESLANRCRDLPSGFGNSTLGDLIDRTPKNTLAKYMMEEKLFNTWYDGRTCLVGDACHKMVNYAGLSGDNALMDVACLASMLHHLPPEPSLSMINKAFECYRLARFGPVKNAMNFSRQIGKTILYKGIMSDWIRKSMVKMPRWAHDKMLDRFYFPVIPVVSFLPKPLAVVACSARCTDWTIERELILAS